MIWLVLKILAVWNWIEETSWECWTWLKIRVHPDSRPTDEILADVKSRLEQMPAAKEIHSAHRIIENIQQERARGRGGR